MSRTDCRRQVGALLLGSFFALPLVFVLTGSLRQPGEPPPRGVEWLPSPLSFSNYGDAFELVDLAHYVRNSTLVAVIAVPLTILCASWAGFAMTRVRSRARGLILGISLTALMVPVTALIVSRFTLFEALGLTNTFVPLIAPALLGTSPFYVLIYYWSFRRLPSEQFDVGRLEGLGPIGAWWRIGLPQVQTTTVAIAALTFVVTWGNFIDPLVYLSDERRFTVPLGLRSLAALDAPDQPLMLAGAVATTIPLVAAFVLVQRWLFQERRPTGELGT